MEKELDILETNEEGYARVVEFETWVAANINYAPRYDELNFYQVERHLKTDEVFILTEGEATLVIGKDLERVPMEKGKMYNVKQGVWHHIFLSKDAKVLVIENSDTGKANTEYWDIL